MPRNRILKAAIACVFTLFLVLTSFSPLVGNPQPAVGECVDCGVSGETIELKYDSGIPFGQMHDQFGGCQKCQAYQGVLFSLPAGISTSVLRKVRFYAGGGTANVGIHIMKTGDDGFTPGDYLAPKTAVKISGEQWYEISLADIQVPNRFWFFLEITDLKVAPFYDERRGVHDGMERSFNGYLPYSLVTAPPGTIDEFKRPQGDFLIRAYIVPEATVGKGAGYDYDTIQEAVDSVWDGWRILVHEGTYNENVTVDKSVTIRSLSGPAKTVVQTSPPYSGHDVFRVTADCVKLSGFTIQGASYSGGAGVYVDHASSCVIFGNVIQGNSRGIYLSDSSMCNILLENECQSNETGIYVDGSENYISGNNLHGNTAQLGSAVFLSSIASGNPLRFNTITVDPGTDPTIGASPQVYSQSTEDASVIENWWGTDTGPANAGGQGPTLGDRVLYDPWLTKQPLRVKTVASGAGDYAMDATGEMSTVVVKQGTGTPFVSAASFAENPFAKFPGKPMGKWRDVLFSNPVGIDQVEIAVYYTADEIAAQQLKEGSLRLFWWNGEKWKVCSKTSVDKKNDFVRARVNLKTKPNTSDLTGTMFAVGVPKGGFAWWLIPVIILIVLLLLIVIRIVWGLVSRRGGGYTSID